MLFSNETLETGSNFSIELLRNRESYNMGENHFHDFYELYYQLSGGRRYFIGDRIYPVRKGDFVFINEYDLHRTMAGDTPEYSRILVSFRRPFLGELLPELGLPGGAPLRSGVIAVPAGFQAEVEILLFRLLEEHRGKLPGSSLALRAGLVLLLIELTRRAAAQPEPPADERGARQKLFAVTRFIGAHYADPLTLEGISRRFGFSPWYFCRIFKKETGFTFVEYLHAVRIREACRLLEDTSLPVTEVAGRVGFDSPTHFGRVFRSVVKVPPSSLRRARRQGKA